MRSVQQLEDEQARDALTESIYSVVEYLSLLPNDLLREVTAFSERSQRLPSFDELRTRDEADTAIVLDQANRRAKMARGMLVSGFLRYALRMARNFVGKGLDYTDLVQEGTLGLMRAAQRYDYRVTARFATYAATWIWQGISRAISDQSRTIRLPVHMCDQVEQVASTMYEMGVERLTDALLEEVALRTGSSQTEVLEETRRKKQERGRITGQLKVKYRKAIRRIRDIARYSDPPLCIDAVLPRHIQEQAGILMEGDNPDVTLGDCVVDDRIADPSLDLSAMYSAQIERALHELTERSRSIIEMRYGLRDGVEHTLEECGTPLGLTRERIRQLEKRALAAMKTALGGKSARSTFFPGTAMHYDCVPRAVNGYLEQKLDHHRARHKERPHNLDWLDQWLADLPGGDWHDRRGGVTRREQIITALRTLGQPTHYVDIADQVNAALTDDLDTTSVYNALHRYDETFIRFGEGVFSLVDWETERTKQYEPLLPFCPEPLSDPPGTSDSFFESVLVAQNLLEQHQTTKEFFTEILTWAHLPPEQPKWLLQSILASYYLVGLLPYISVYSCEDREIASTLPSELDLQQLRIYCLRTLTQRLAAMPEFWWLLQRHQPIAVTDLATRFGDIYDLGLYDTNSRLSYAISIGVVRRGSYGRYELTPFGERALSELAAPPRISTPAVQDETDADSELDLLDFALW